MFDGFRTILSRSLVHNLYCYKIKIPNVHFEKDSKLGMSFDVLLLTAEFQKEPLAILCYFIGYWTKSLGWSSTTSVVIARSITNVTLGGILFEIQPREAICRSYCTYSLYDIGDCRSGSSSNRTF